MRSQYRETVVDDPQNPVIFWLDPETGSDIVVTTHPAPGYTVEEVIAQVLPPNTDWYVCEYQQCPQRQIFRDAWRMGDGEIVVDFPVAKAIAKDNVKFLLYMRLQEEKLLVPSMFLTAEDEARLAEIKTEFDDHLARVEAAVSVGQLYQLQDEEVLEREYGD